jgi:hypothetical protein
MPSFEEKGTALWLWRKSAKPYMNPHRISGDGRAIEAGCVSKETLMRPAFCFAQKRIERQSTAAEEKEI